MTDFTSLPPGLPVPEDDGAADHLEGATVAPGTSLPSTLGSESDLAALAGEGPGGSDDPLLVVYVYPRTGTPGEPLIEGWDDIPGARGCTPQSCAYRDALAEFESLDAAVVGVSAQTPAEQAEFAEREQIPFPLLADPELRLAESLGLPTFEAGGITLYRRLTMVLAPGEEGERHAERGRRVARIAKSFYPVFPPDRDAAAVLAWLGEHRQTAPPVSG